MWRSSSLKGYWDEERITEDDFLGGREHVERERYFVLVALSLQPVDEAGEA